MVVVFLINRLVPVFSGDVGVGYYLLVERPLGELYSLCSAVEFHVYAYVPPDLFVDRNVSELGPEVGSEMVELLGVGASKDYVIDVYHDECG